MPLFSSAQHVGATIAALGAAMSVVAFGAGSDGRASSAASVESVGAALAGTALHAPAARGHVHDGRLPTRSFLPTLPDFTERPPAAAVPASTVASWAAGHLSGASLYIGRWHRRVQPGGQGLVNTCQVAVLWHGPMPARGSKGTSVIVGHNNCGYQLFSSLSKGTIVTFATPKGVVQYQVYAHGYVDRHGGSPAGLYRGDLTLQSCVGPGTGFSYLRKL